MSYSRPFLSMYDTTTQNIAIANTSQLVTFNTTLRSNKITITSSSRFTVLQNGLYVATIAPQINLTSGTNRFMNLFIKVNGTTVTASGNRWGIPTVNSDQTDTTILIGMLNANDYIEFWINGDSTNLQLLTVAASGDIPLVPSAIFTLAMQD